MKLHFPSTVAAAISLFFVALPLSFAADASQGRAATDETIQFELDDALGRRISSTDYKGTPIFLEFGACW